MKIVNRKRPIEYSPILIWDEHSHSDLTCISNQDGVEIYSLRSAGNLESEILHVTWKFPAVDIKGSWSSNLLLDKRIRADWEVAQLQSSISVDAPILCLFGHDDRSRLCFACSDSKNLVELEAGLREEDNHIYCALTFHRQFATEEDQDIFIWIDRKEQHFAHSLRRAADWTRAHLPLPIVPTPDSALLPTYSTWYSYHQDFTAEDLLNECRLAKKLGMDLVIVDDGWQTLDDRRGYDYTGDWEPERFANIAGFVDQVHELKMKIMFWFSVPFCGVKSKAYQKFKGKFLTENHHWAPVFDPRYPDVRAHLVSKYDRAIREWGADGLKLDFIDDFCIYPETPLELRDGMDTRSVADGVQRLMKEIRAALHSINPDVLIEFRQKYISPALQILGNMFRAFDCPNDSTLNRIRTTDVKLLCGGAAVHSDMITWSHAEPVDIAALQFTSILFSVPQISVRLNQLSKEETAMLSHFIDYWSENKEILMSESFTPSQPLVNYPILRADGEQKTIFALYADMMLNIETDTPAIDIVNGKLTYSVVLMPRGDNARYTYEIVDCQGELKNKGEISLNEIRVLHCPLNGIVKLLKINSDS